MQFESNKKSNQTQKLEQDYAKLKNLSQDELMTRLYKEIDLQKKNGSFDYDGLVKAVESIKIYLPQATYENIMKILENLR